MYLINHCFDFVSVRCPESQLQDGWLSNLIKKINNQKANSPDSLHYSLGIERISRNNCDGNTLFCF